MKVIDKIIINNNPPPEYKSVIWVDCSDKFIPKIWIFGKWRPLGCKCCKDYGSGDFNNDFNNDFLIW